MSDIFQVIGSIATLIGGIAAIIQLYLWYIEYLKPTKIDDIAQVIKSDKPRLVRKP